MLGQGVGQIQELSTASMIDECSSLLVGITKGNFTLSSFHFSQGAFRGSLKMVVLSMHSA